jgi:hypothetical protein
MILPFDAWGEVLYDVSFLTEATRFKTFADALEISLGPAEDGQWWEDSQSYVWELRRLFWIELIPRGRIRVMLAHSGATGAGICPATLLRARSDDPVSEDLTLWPEDDSLVYEAECELSDQIYMSGMEDGHLFGWSEIELLNIWEIEHDDERFEHSFSSKDVIQVSRMAQAPGWSSLGEAGQAKIVEELSQLIFTQLEKSDMLEFDPRDVLAMIAAHPDTFSAVTEKHIYLGEKALLYLLM